MKTSDDLFEYFNANVTRLNCWIWTGRRTSRGYGSTDVDGGTKTKLCHRMAWEIYKGPIPEGMCVLHTCDIRSCVNPEHLFLGTRSDNIIDAKTKGRISRGENHFRAKLTPGDIRRIRLDHRPQRVIMAEFGISRSYINAIKRRSCWTHIN